MSQMYWDRLDSQFMVFDSTGYRGQTLFGRLSIDSFLGFTLSQFVPYQKNPNPFDSSQSGIWLYLFG